tara:strand:- start:1136 stop:1387 length:252 start_codon:yes stop_codon:yes gene_type:complete
MASKYKPMIAYRISHGKRVKENGLAQRREITFIALHLHATLAQLVEQLIRNEQVVGSNPMGGSIFFLPAKNRTLRLEGSRNAI